MTWWSPGGWLWCWVSSQLLVSVPSKTAITSLMRISWRTAGHILARVSAEKLAAADPLAGLSRIGIDEISCKRGHKHIMVVAGHDTGRLV